MRSYLSFLAAIIALVAVLNACSPQRTILEQVIASNELHVLTRNAGTTYYEGPQGPTGFEYQLAKLFAKHLGVKLKITVPDSLNDILEQVSDGSAHLAAAGLTVTELRSTKVRFSPTYQSITQQIVYHRGKKRPKSIKDLDGILEVLANSSHAERLNELNHNNTALTWIENQEADSTELLTLVAEELIDYTVADSNEVAFNRRYYPELKVAFNITKPQPLAWAFPKGDDDSLYVEAAKFLNGLKKSGELENLIEAHYQHVNNYDYTGTHSFLAHTRRRLPTYRESFELAAEKYDLDWRLLAAVAYQESHWRPQAVSPTGVRGMMMLTQATAEHLGVLDRTDPQESILGGAKYIRKLIDRIPERIKDTDRIWMALASYNVGYGHMNDARIIAQQKGDNPDNWVDVKANLPLLGKRKWYKKTKHGYARGWEPVRYVDNIRSYYDILVWHLERENPQLKQIRPILAFSSNAL